jgi:hypothetical protein
VLPRSRFLRLLALCPVIGLWSPTLDSLVFNCSLSHYSPLDWLVRYSQGLFFSHPLLPMTIQSPSPHQMQKSFYLMCIASTFLVAAILASGEDFRNDCTRAWAFLRRKKTSSRRITVLVSLESHRPTETVMSERDPEYHRHVRLRPRKASLFRHPIDESVERASCSKGV